MRIQRINQTQDAGQAANLIIDAIFDGKSVKAVGSKIAVTKSGSLADMKSAEKDQLVATFLYLVEKKRFESNPEYDPRTSLGQEDLPEFAKWVQTRLPKILTRPSSENPDELIALHDSARDKQTRDLFHALRAAIDVSPEALAVEDGAAEAKIDTAIDLLLNKFPFVLELTQPEYTASLERVSHFATHPCVNTGDVEELTHIWQRLAASAPQIASGKLRTNGWPDAIYQNPEEAKKATINMIAAIHEMTLARMKEYEERVLADAPNTGPNEATERDDNPDWHRQEPVASPAPASQPEPVAEVVPEVVPEPEPEPEPVVETPARGHVFTPRIVLKTAPPPVEMETQEIEVDVALEDPQELPPEPEETTDSLVANTDIEDPFGVLNRPAAPDPEDIS